MSADGIESRFEDAATTMAWPLGRASETPSNEGLKQTAPLGAALPV